jgi:excisionase family DNA binding protein
VSVQTLHDVLLVSEAAEHAQVSVDTIYREIKAGRLRAARIGRCVRIRKDTYEAWLAEREGAA